MHRPYRGSDGARGYRRPGVAAAALFAGCVVAANAAVQRWGFVPVGFGWEAPAGVFFAGAAFTLRDVVHERLGRRAALAAVAAGAVLSWWVAAALAVASGVAFAVSEVADLAVYEPLRRRGLLVAMFVSGVVGSVVDSVLFLELAFGAAPAGQVAGLVFGKVAVTAVFVAALAPVRRRVVAG